MKVELIGLALLPMLSHVTFPRTSDIDLLRRARSLRLHLNNALGAADLQLSNLLN